MKEENRKWDIKALHKEYAPPRNDDLLFTDEEERTIVLKEIISTLPSYDQTIFFIYCELGSLREVAKRLNVSHSAVIKKMDQIKAKIMEKYLDWQLTNITKRINDKIKNEL